MTRFSRRSLIAALALLPILPRVTLAGAELDRIKAAGVLKIGTEGTHPPFTFHDQGGKRVGFDVENGQELSPRMTCGLPPASRSRRCSSRRGRWWSRGLPA
jgi:ABC-type amino acid transport substrate-binding protein